MKKADKEEFQICILLKFQQVAVVNLYYNFPQL